MSTSITFNGSSYTIPATGDDSWGTNVSNYLIAISTGSLQKTGGTFTLTAEVNFGATYGLKVPYIKSQAANPASAGIVRLGNAETIKWRNNANNADLDLTVNSSDFLQFNSNTLLDSSGTGLTGLITNAMVNASAAIAYSKLNLSNSILNADINASAAIAYSKLNLATSIVNADINASAAIAYSKLNLATSIVNADISASAAIAYSKLNLSTSIVDADINASAAIALSKLAALTASRVLVSDGSGFVSASSVTSTTLGYLDATSSIQAQLDAKVAKSTLTTKGDIFVATGSATVVRQAIGSDGQVLTADSAQTNGLKWSAVLVNPMTTGGDIIYGGASGTATRLANGSAGQVLRSAGSTNAPTWEYGARMLGKIQWAATANTQWSTNSTSYGNFSADADAPTPTVTSGLGVTASAPGTKIPAIVLSAIKTGTISIRAWGSFRINSAAASTGDFRFYDGTNSGGDNVLTGAAVTDGINSVYGSITYGSDQGSTTINIQAKNRTGGGGNNTEIDARNETLTIEVWWSP